MIDMGSEGVKRGPLVQFRVGPTLAPELARRPGSLSPSMIVKRDIHRYYELIASARHDSSEHQLGLIRQFISHHEQPISLKLLRALPALLEDAARRPAPTGRTPLFRAAPGHRRVRHPLSHLAARLRELTPTELYALLDRIERA